MSTTLLLNNSQTNLNTIRAPVAIPPDLPGLIAPRTCLPPALRAPALAVAICENIVGLDKPARCPVWIMCPSASVLEEVDGVAQLGRDKNVV